jgi:hypothetical protein
VELVNAHAPTFEQGFDTNRLMIIAQGPQIAFYVNGEPLWFVYDESSSRGTIELGAENRIHDTLLRVHFDNFKVWDITDLPTPTAEATPTPMPTAILAPSPTADQARAFGDPILAAIAGRAPDFEDDFSDPGSGWIDQGAEGHGGYISGEYFLSIAIAEHDVWICSTNYGIPNLSDMVLEYDVRFVTEQVDGETRVTLHSQGGTGFILSVRPDGEVRLGWAPGPALYSELVTQRVSPASLDAEKHLQIIVRGSEIAVYVDDQPLIYSDTSSIEGFPSSGAIWFDASTRESETFEVRLDNLRIWDITDLPVPTP